MATGPEHYQQAEQHLGFAANAMDPQIEQAHLQHAQVHATLALAAATALGSDQPAPDLESWNDVAGEPPTPPPSAAGR